MEKLIDSRSVGFLARLRSNTEISHKRLESLPISKLLVDSKISTADYALYLNLMHDVVYSMEKNVYPLLESIVPDLEARKKNRLILTDLQILEIKKTATVSVFGSEALTNPGFGMGMLYVLEGSTLGGRYILKNITENLSFNAEKGALYFAGYGNKTGSFWKKFLDILTAFEAENDAEAAIIEGADFAFRTIEKHLSQNTA